MKTYLFPAVKITFLTLLLFGIAYPVLIVGIAKLVAPNSGKGELVEMNEKVVGFALIGQKFDTDQYFNSRPSAVDYNAAATGGSNKGPGNADYLAVVEQRVEDFMAKNPAVNKSDIPVDLVTASGGGLDPHISIQAAIVQIPRIAKVRGLKAEDIQRLVEQQTIPPLLSSLGTSTVHVLKLNIALDKLK